MIAKLKGEVSYRGKDFIILDVGPIGYRLMVPDFAVPTFQGEMMVFTHEVVRDDNHELFAFADMDSLEMFWKLINVSGVGPRSAQKIVFAGTGEEVRSKIIAGNLAFLQSVPGIGKKTGQKIILELNGVLMEDEGIVPSADEDAIAALTGLGYKRREAVQVLDGLEGETEDKIRAALKALART
ncbi:MAG: Holliday junction branch migration protein RuvA [bacterium]|nr:Holliday junction branch migration protein RuvA [bacterium]